MFSRRTAKSKSGPRGRSQWLSRLRPRSLGQGLVEFALILPVAALVLLLTIDFGRAYFQWITLNNVAKIGANFAALHPEGWEGLGDPAVKTAYRNLMSQDSKEAQSTCPLQSPIPDPTFPAAAPNTYAVGGQAQLQISCQFALLTPLIQSVFGGSSTLQISASSVFTIRGGALNGIPVSTVAPTGTATATSTPTSTATGTATTPTATVSFYGVPRAPNSQGGGPPGSPGEAQVVGLPGLIVDFTFATTGTRVSCLWDFSDGPVVNSCAGMVAHTFSSNTRRTYNVTLTVDGVTVSRTAYVLIGCQVPSFTGVKKNDASDVWLGAGFVRANLTTLNPQGGGNYFINNQSLPGGLLNPAGGCTGATITVGP